MLFKLLSDGGGPSTFTNEKSLNPLSALHWQSKDNAKTSAAVDRNTEPS